MGQSKIKIEKSFNYTRTMKDFYVEQKSIPRFGVIVSVDSKKDFDENFYLTIINDEAEKERVMVCPFWNKGIENFYIGQPIVYIRSYYTKYYDANPIFEDYKLDDDLIKNLFGYFLIGEDYKSFTADSIKADHFIYKLLKLSEFEKLLFVAAFIYGEPCHL